MIPNPGLKNGPHPRVSIVADAQFELAKFIRQTDERLELTSAEWVKILAQAMTDVANFEIKEERKA